jgi:nicotinate-nucleotide adenylyltransferase
MQRIGILGGTFDPIHHGHLAAALEACWALRLAHIFLIPAAQQPLKHAPHLAAPAQRLEMVRRACAGNQQLVPSDIELRRAPPSYTIDTVRELRRIAGDGAQLWFVLGGDALTSFPNWHAADQIVQLARLAVIRRPGTQIDMAPLVQALPDLQDQVDMIDGPMLDIASTDLRQRIARGQPVRYQMPDSVIAYIEEQRLYREH